MRIDDRGIASDHKDATMQSADADRLSMLMDIVLGISSSLELQNTLDSIVQSAAAVADAHIASIWLREPDGTYRARAAFGVALDVLRPLHLDADEGLLGQAKRAGRPVQVTDFGRDVKARAEALEQVVRTGVRATVAAPLKQDGEIIGALYAAKDGTSQFPDTTLDALQRLASFAQVALINARRFSDMEAEREKLQAYLDAIPEGVIIFDRKGNIALINRTLERELGGQPDHATALPDEVLRQPHRLGNRTVRFRYNPNAVFQRVLSTGLPEQGLLEMEAPACTYEVNFNALRTSAGDIEGVVATLRDITTTLDLERERSRSHILAQLLDLSAGLNSSLSIPALLERVVEAAMELLGARSGMMGLIEGDTLVFRRICTRGDWVDVDIVLERGTGLGGHVWQTGRPYVANNRLDDPHVGPALQSRFGFHRSVVVPVADSAGKIIGTLHTHDPTVERDFGRMDEEALQLLANQAAIAVENARLSELKDEFLSIVSHELKTPITSIKGFTQVLQHRLPLDSLERVGRYLEVLNHQADRLTILINDLLDVSRIQRGRFQFDVRALHYDSFVREVIGEMQLLEGRHRTVLDVAGPVQVRGNQDRLRQVLVNLLDNAYRYGPASGPVTVKVDVVGSEVITSICDVGATLSASEAEHVFALYYQVRNDAKRVTQGLGLGLYVSRQIVEAHGGRIWVETSEGTRFRFSLPVE